MDRTSDRLLTFFAIAMLLIASINCNGLRSVDKIKNYIGYIEEKHYNVCLLQETFWSDDIIGTVKSLYNGTILYSNSNTNRQGVAVLISNRYKDKVKQIYCEMSGRFLHVSFEECDKTVNIMNLYAPNNVHERVLFFNFVHEYMKDFDNVVLGGDFNTSLSILDRARAASHVEDAAFKALNSLIDDTNVYDVWRARNTGTRHFSFKRLCNDCIQQSRIDYYLISRSLCNNVQSIFYVDTCMSDHAFVVMNVKFDNVDRGPGLWIFNNMLLYDDDFVDNVKHIIEDQKSCTLYDTDFLIWWDNLKYKIKRYAQVYGTRRAKEKRKEYFVLQNKFKRLSEEYATGKRIDIASYENLKAELKDYESVLCKGAILRSKAYWACESDCNSKYFFDLERYKQESNSIKELLCDDGRIVTDTDSILDEQLKFYSTLYSCVDIDENKMNQLLDFNDRYVNEDDVVLCDSDICEDEVRKALWGMSCNKSPGSDGLTVEFYRHFYSQLKDIFIKLYSCIYEQKSLSRSMKIGVLSIFYKKKGDRNLLKEL